jgi:serine/threonine protein kinase
MTVPAQLLTLQLHIQVYIVDFGLAGLTPDQEQAAQDKDYMYTNFQGTPDYASTDALNSLICSAKVQNVGPEKAQQMQK